MARKPTLPTVAEAGLLSTIFIKLDKAVTNRGGTPDQVHFLATHEGAAWVNPIDNHKVGYLDGSASGRDCDLSWCNPSNRWNAGVVFPVRRRK